MPVPVRIILLIASAKYINKTLTILKIISFEAFNSNIKPQFFLVAFVVFPHVKFCSVIICIKNKGLGILILVKTLFVDCF